MRRLRAYGFVVCAVVPLLAGCNALIRGTWRAVEPAAISAEVPRIRQVTFQLDGTFEGRMTQRNRTTGVHGTYRFDGTWLQMTPDGAVSDPLYEYHVLRLGHVLLLSQNGTVNRLCRETAGTLPPPPALPEDLVEPEAVPLE